MKDNTFNYTVEQFADLQLLRYRVPDFEHLSLQQKKLVYYLTEAALHGRDILFDQNGKYNLQIRKLLEAVYLHFKGDRTCDDFKALEVYLKRVWFSSGIHHHYACDKFEPGFSQEFLWKCMQELNDTDLAFAKDETREDLRRKLFPVIFDASVMPKRVNQADGADLVVTSAANY